MTDQRPDRDVDLALRAWMDEVAPKRAPGRLLEATFARTMRARQARRYPWHRAGVGPLSRVAGHDARRSAILALAVVVVVATAVVTAGGGLHFTAPPTPTPSASNGPTPAASATPAPSLPAATVITPEATVAQQNPLAMVAEGQFLWVMAPGRLDRIDPRTNTVTASVTLGPATHLYNGLAANAAGLWATDADAAVVYRVDPVQLKVVAAIPAGRSPKGVLATADGVWVADVHGGAVLRIDPATNRVSATISVGPIGNSGPNWLASGLGSIWVDVPNIGILARMDPASDSVQASIQVPVSLSPCGGIAIGTAAVWVTGCSLTAAVGRADPSTNTMAARVDLPGSGYLPTLIGDSPWLSIDGGDPTSGRLIRIDPATNAIDRVLVPSTTLGGGGDIVVLAGSVWVLDGYNNTVLRLPLTAFAP